MTDEVELSKEFKDCIVREQVRLAMLQVPTMQATSFIVALVLSCVVRHIVVQANILAWILILLPVIVSRIVLYYRFSKVLEGPFAGEYWKNIYVILALFSGIVWGLSAFIIFPAGNPALISLFVLVIASLSAATTVSHSSIRFAPAAWAGPAMLSYAVRCVIEGGEFGYTVGFLIIVYLFTVLRYSFTHHKSITSAIASRFENLQLLEELQKVTDTLSQENANRKQAEQVLRESEGRYRSVFENSFDGILLTTPDGGILAASPSACRIFKMTEEEICRAGRAGLADIEDPRLAVLLQERARSGKAVSELTHIRKNGTRFPAEVSSVVFKDPAGSERSCTIIRDISARKEAEEALRRSEANLRVVLEATADGILAVDDKGKTIKANRRFTDLWKIPQSLMDSGDEEEMLQFVLDQLVDPVPFLEKVKSLYGTAELDMDTLIFKDGRVLERFSAPLTQEGSIMGRVWSFRDITESKRAEAERLEMERRLLHAQKLESLGVLAGGIAHDFNNLLMAVLGNLELTLLSLPKDSPARSRILQAIQASRRATDLTRQMLAYSGKGHFMVVHVDLSDLVWDNADLFRTAIARTITLNLALSSQASTIQADPGQVQQVIMNLITNASEAIGETPGVIGLATGMMECDERYLSRSVLDEKPPAGRFAYVEVSDTGCGMDEGTQRRLFEPFFTTKFTGRGLGMAAVLGIMRGHQGAILLDSAVAQGTTIRVLFPACEVGLAEPVEISEESPSEPLMAGTVLVVDDEGTVRNLCLDYLRELGFRATGAADGEEALDIFKKHAEEITCVLLDLTMPRLDGLSTFREMKRLRPDIPVILCSGYSEQDATQHFTGQGLAGFIQKPYSLEELQIKIKQALHTLD